MTRADRWPPGKRIVAFGTLGGMLSFFGVSLGYALFMGAGHGSSLPGDMLIAPFGVGLIIWPICFSLLGVPRRFLVAALACALALTLIHACGAVAVYLSGQSELARLRSLRTEASLFALFAVFVGIAGPFCIAARLFLVRKGGEGFGEKPIGMNPVGK